MHDPRPLRVLPEPEKEQRIAQIGTAYQTSYDSLRTIAAKYGCSEKRIRQLAQEHGWQRTASGAVASAAKVRAAADLATDDLDDDGTLQNEDLSGRPANMPALGPMSEDMADTLLARAVERTAAVIRAHQREATTLRQLAREHVVNLVEHRRHMRAHVEAYVQEYRDLHGGDEPPYQMVHDWSKKQTEEDIKRLERLVSLFHGVHQLERRAYNIDADNDDQGEQESYEDRLRRRYEAARAVEAMAREDTVEGAA